MNILIIAAEVAPFVKVGGLSQVTYFLSQELIKLGHDVRIFTPKYGVMEEKKFLSQCIHKQIPVDLDGLYTQKNTCNIRLYNKKSTSVPTYFLENREFFELRANVFAYKDDHIRFFLLSRGCLEWLRIQKQNKAWMPDIIHCHDWHTGYFIDEARRNETYTSLLRDIPILYTVHNFQFQGNYDFKYVKPKKRDDGVAKLNTKKQKKLQKQNALLRGMLYADWVNTVSPTHAVEVVTEEYGEGLETYLQKMRGKLSGILNGLDFKEFDPKSDPFLYANYSLKTFKKRKLNKQDLQHAFNLPKKNNVPVFGFVGRLSKQKGLHLLLPIIEKVLQEVEAQFVFVGGGDSEFRRQLKRLQKQFPENVGAHVFPDFKLPRKIFSGADCMIIPSIFEPCGIVGLESLRYGAVPIVRQTGGLADMVEEFDPDTKQGSGFMFKEKSEWSIFAALMRAITLYRCPNLFQKIVKNAMRMDFTWKTTAKEYDQLYNQVVEQRKRFCKANPHQAYKPN